MKKPIMKTVNYILITLGIIVAVVGLKTSSEAYGNRFFAEVTLSGFSMYPTFKTDQVVLINSSPIRRLMLEHNQFVEVKISPVASNKKGMLKRVIGLPGDHLVIKGNTIERNGKIVEEPYLNEEEWNITGEDDSDIVIPENYIYVLGDNRNHSTDSRSLGLINIKKQLVGVYVRTLEEAAF